MRIKTICRDRRASGKVGIGVFFKALSFQQQEGIGQADQGHLMMPALPAAPFVMIHSQFFFELLIILLHPPDAAARASDGLIKFERSGGIRGKRKAGVYL